MDKASSDQRPCRIIAIIIQFTHEHQGHFIGTPFNFISFFAGKKVINGFAKNAQPNVKMPLINRHGCVWRKRSAKISMIIQKNGLPKTVHFFQMIWPAVSDSFVKDRANKLVLPNL